MSSVYMVMNPEAPDLTVICDTPETAEICRAQLKTQITGPIVVMPRWVRTAADFDNATPQPDPEKRRRFIEFPRPVLPHCPCVVAPLCPGCGGTGYKGGHVCVICDGQG